MDGGHTRTSQQIPSSRRQMAHTVTTSSDIKFINTYSVATFEIKNNLTMAIVSMISRVLRAVSARVPL